MIRQTAQLVKTLMKSQYWETMHANLCIIFKWILLYIFFPLRFSMPFAALKKVTCVYVQAWLIKVFRGSGHFKPIQEQYPPTSFSHDTVWSCMLLCFHFHAVNGLEQRIHIGVGQFRLHMTSSKVKNRHQHGAGVTFSIFMLMFFKMFKRKHVGL